MRTKDSWFRIIIGKREVNPISFMLAKNSSNIFLLSNSSSKDLTAATLELVSGYLTHDNPDPIPPGKARARCPSAVIVL